MQAKEWGQTVRDNVGERFFTVESANRSLVLVEKIVGDITLTYATLLRERSERDRISSQPGRAAEAASIGERMEAHVERLETLAAELRLIGCELKDWATGLVDFPAWLDGEPILLCWRLGETEITHWHGLHAGFAGRKPVTGCAERIVDSPPAHSPAAS